MPKFSYQAANQEQDTSSGIISAESVSAALAQLEAQGLHVTSIQKNISSDAKPSASEATSNVGTPNHGPSAPSPKTNPRSAYQALPKKEQQVLHQRISKRLENRHPLVSGLAAFAQELPPGRQRRELNHLVKQIKSGATAEELCSNDHQTASWLLLLGQGKDSQGKNSQLLLSGMFEEATRENESQTQWNRAFIYPAFVLLGSLSVLFFLCTTVISSFQSIFDDFDLDLPEITVQVILFSNNIIEYPFRFVLGILTVILGSALFFRRIRYWGLPGRRGNLLTSGNSWQVTAMARFTRRLAEGLDAGLALPTALKFAATAQNKSRLGLLALQLASEAQQQHFDLSKSPAGQRLPSTLIHALQAAPNNLPSIPLLHQLSEIYSTRIRDRHNWSTGFLAQFVMIGLGLTVGIVVLALFLPLVELINGLTG